MKRILLLASAIAFIIVMTACGGNNSESKEESNSNNNSATAPNGEHTCTYDAREEKVNPTCESEGYTLLFCSCGNSKKEVFEDALGHSYSEWTVDTEPTVSSVGKLRRTCANGHEETITLPYLNDTDYTITSKDGTDLSSSCAAPSYVLYTYKQTVYDDATSSDREFSFEAIYTSEHTSSDTYVYSSENHYHKCSVCEGFDQNSAEGHNMSDGKCSVCNYIPCDVIYSEEYYGLSVSYTANNYELVIPEYYSGSDISHVGKKIEGIKSFGNNSELRFITIPASIKYIEPFAFDGCSSLERVYYAGTWEQWCSIDFGAQSNPMIYASTFCMLNKNNMYYEVSEITLPDTVTVIPSSAFEGFGSMTSLTIPKSVTAIGSNLNDVFSQDMTIGTVYYKGDITDWCKIAISGRYSNPMQFTSNFYMTNNRGAYYQPTQLVTGEDITEIGDYQFISYKPLTQINTNASLTKIGKYAFKDCTALMFVNVFKGCEKIGAYAFCGCTMLVRLDLPKNLSESGDFAFEGCNRLSTINYRGDFDTWSRIKFSTAASNPMHVNVGRSYDSSIVFSRYFEDSGEFYPIDAEMVILSKGLEALGDYQFYGFSRIAAIILPDGLTSIGKEAAAFCTNLSSLIIPVSVKEIGKNIVNGMKNFVEIYYFGTENDWSTIEIDPQNTDLNSVNRYYYAADVSAVTSEFNWGYMSSGAIAKWKWDSYNEAWYLG